MILISVEEAIKHLYWHSIRDKIWSIYFCMINRSKVVINFVYHIIKKFNCYVNRTIIISYLDLVSLCI